MGYKRSQILSVATAIPEKEITNQDLEKMVNTSDEWIMKRTGIKTRFVAPEGVENPLTEYSARAVVKAIERAGITPVDVDTIICGTVTPDYFFPSTACLVASRIGCKDAFAFDFTSACSGFVYGLVIANSLIVSGQSKTVVVIGGEILSRCVDWTDRGTCILFADGVGAVVMQGTDDPDKGILATHEATDGSLGDILNLSAWDETRYIMMKGKEVFKYAITLMTETTLKSLEACSMTTEDIDIFIPHQANIRIINAIAKNLNIPSEKVIANIDRFGNTSSATIPIALAEAWEDGKIKDGTVVALSALGGGVTIGSVIIRF
jgi:3-oxoacyl-[acyl-carrier-protein] synthase-3